jgi:hypothetical protein
MYLLYHDLQRSRNLVQREGGVEGRAPWIFKSLPDKQEVLNSYRELLWNNVNWDSSPSVSLIGFKEVRWNFYDDLKDVDFLLELFPCAKLLLNYRTDVDEQVKSGFWAHRNKNGAPTFATRYAHSL